MPQTLDLDPLTSACPLSNDLSAVTDTVIGHCRGTSGLDIDLRVVDINQCHANTSSFNIFGGTDKCKKETTTVTF